MEKLIRMDPCQNLPIKNGSLNLRSLNTKRSFIAASSRAHSQQTYKVYDPVSEHLLASVASCDYYDVDQGIQSAQRLKASGHWIQTPITKRKQILNSFIRLIVDNREELALLETLDMGKQAVDSLHLDTMGASAILRSYAKGEQKLQRSSAFKIWYTVPRKQPSLILLVLLVLLSLVICHLSNPIQNLPLL